MRKRRSKERKSFGSLKSEQRINKESRWKQRLSSLNFIL